VEVVVDYHSNATTEALSSKGILAKVLVEDTFFLDTSSSEAYTAARFHMH